MKKFIILLSSVVSLFASLEKGDSYYNNKNFTKALEYYKGVYNETKSNKAKMRLVVTYIKIGDGFFNIQSYRKAKENYQIAYKLGASLAKRKLSNVYKKQGELFEQGKRFQEAYEKYKKAYEYGNEQALEKKQKVLALLEHQNRLSNDTRKEVTEDSPLWTRSVGRLVVPVKPKRSDKKLNKKIEKCSASLVNFENKKSSKVIITASHCITYYDQKEGVLTFLIRSKDGQIIQKFAKIYKDSDFDIEKMEEKSDYSILLLSSAIEHTDVPPLIIPKKSFTQLQKEFKNSFASLGGFSSDVGDFGSNLTYDPRCGLEPYNEIYAKSTCSGFKGASGGPVVLNIQDTNKRIKSYFVGVISHFKNDAFNNIFFAPHHIFYKDIQKAIDSNNH